MSRVTSVLAHLGTLGHWEPDSWNAPHSCHCIGDIGERSGNCWFSKQQQQPPSPKSPKSPNYACSLAALLYPLRRKPGRTCRPLFPLRSTKVPVGLRPMQLWALSLQGELQGFLNCKAFSLWTNPMWLLLKWTVSNIFKPETDAKWCKIWCKMYVFFLDSFFSHWFDSRKWGQNISKSVRQKLSRTFKSKSSYRVCRVCFSNANNQIFEAQELNIICERAGFGSISMRFYVVLMQTHISF